jgi:hypothetical protein
MTTTFLIGIYNFKTRGDRERSKKSEERREEKIYKSYIKI